MRRLFTYLIVFNFTFNSFASCGGVLKSFLGMRKSSFYDTPEYALKQKINKLEILNNRLRNSSEHQEPATTLAIWKKIERLDNNIFTKHYSVNVRDWEVFFRDFEMNFISFQRLSDINKKFESTEITKAKLKSYIVSKGYASEFQDFILSKFENSPNAEIFKIQLDKEIQSNLLHIGNHYYEYRLVREHLRDLNGSDLCNSECEAQLKTLLANLGVESEKEQRSLPVFFKGVERPDLEELNKVVHENPVALLTKLKKERNAEVVNWLISLMLQPEIIDSIMGLVYKSKRIGKYRAVRIFQAFYNAQARTIHFPKINSIVKSFKNDVEKSYSHLKNVNTSVPKDEILVTFARMVDALAVKKWKILKEHAKTADPKFYERMMAAEEKAIARGDISITHKRSLIGQLIQFVPASTPIYLYQRSKLEERATVTEVDENGEEIDSKSEESSPEVTIEHGDEMDLALEEVAEVMAEVQETQRNPSSIERSWIERFFSRIESFFRAEG
ncbi:hypothetical protein [Halobacteriovorax sp. RT-1-4]|uniref:hypothetical protein n=1 Tax=unclassified Halobacteriovorax TaxID=2639665 RepID=UPI0039994E65